jgi:hypothetical protein
MNNNQTWLEEHNATVWFSDGKKVGLEFSRLSGGLRLQVSAWTLDEAVEQAKALLRRAT